MSEGKVPAKVHTSDTERFLTLLYFIAESSNREIYKVKENMTLFKLQIPNKSY